MARRRPAPREPVAVRRARVLARIDHERAEVASSWRTIGGIVAEREPAALAIAQGLVTAVKLGGAGAAIWMAGRLRAPRLVRRGMMLFTAARTAASLFARRDVARRSRWQKA